jgi:NADPH-dependent 2,4-dienoyl-CoA reductase/sulfur reductase-like enzyme
MKCLSNKRLIIVGGVAGGASAAARARRLCEDCEIIMFERGPHVSFANCGLPYFVGGEIAEQDRVKQALARKRDRKKIRREPDLCCHVSASKIPLPYRKCMDLER